MEYQKLDYSVIKIYGDDSAKFLQSIITSDVNNAGNIYTLMLTPQGKFVFDLFISKVNNDYYIEIASNKIDILISKIKLYILRSKVFVEPMYEYSVIYSHEPTNIDTLCQYYDPRISGLGIRSVILSENLIGEETNLYLEDKYKFAIPEGYTELVQDKSMPQEYGMDQLNAISYTKGCYIGQEVISRVKYQGVIRKKIFQASSDFDLSNIPNGSDIFFNGNKIGILCSAYKNLGICLIRTDNDLQLDNLIVTVNDDITLKLNTPIR